MAKHISGRDKTCKVLALLTLSWFVLSLAGCETALLMPLIQLDSTDNLTYTGMKLVDQAKYREAGRAFEMALQADCKNSQALTGRGLVKAYTSDFKGAKDDLEQARAEAMTDAERLLNHIAMIRYYTQSRLDADWLAKSLTEFEQALAIDTENAAVFYFIGLAHRQACSFDEADAMFARVLSLQSDYLAEASAQSAFLHKVRQAMPVTDAGRRIALAESITRADTAVLLMRELKIDDLYERRAQGVSRASSHQTSSTDKTAGDIANNPWKRDIEGILKIGVRGLEADPEGNFVPGTFLTRAKFAVILEDIMVTVTGDKTLVRRFAGFRSPFPDVTNSSPYFNAAMVATTRGLMSVRSETTKEFALHKTVAGIEALLSIRTLKDKWNYQ
jgi:tetratricopeptide (TPR) repeat protein